MTRFFILSLFLLLGAFPVHAAQESRTDLKAGIDANLPSGSQLKALPLRNELKDIADSAFIPLSDSPLPTANGGTGAASLPTAVDAFTGASGTDQGFLARNSDGTYAITAETAKEIALCSLSLNRTTCISVRGYADPRWYGAGCNGNDDSGAIQSALNTGKDVYIPPGCRLHNKINFVADGQTIFSLGQGSRYNSNYPGNNYLFIPNQLWDNRATSLNCAIDTRGYDNVTVRNVAVRANFNLVGSVAFCNSVGIQSGRGAAFLNLENVSCLNIGGCIGAAMTSYFDYDATSTTSNTLGTGTFNFTTETGKLWQTGDVINATANGISPTTRMTGTVTSYNSGTGALVMDSTSITGTAGTYANWNLNTSNKCTPISTGSQAGIHNNVFQMRIKGLDTIGNCMGLYANGSDVHMTDWYCANQNHNCVSSLAGFGSGWDINNGRVEYSGLGAGPSTAKTYFNDAAGMYLDGPFGVNVSNLTCDHQYGTCVTGGPNAKNITLNNIHSIDSGYTNAAGITDKGHFAFLGVDGVSASNITTRRNGVATPYVVTFRGTNNYVYWQGAGGAQGSGAVTGGWETSYFNFVTTPNFFTYCVMGVGCSIGGADLTINSLLAYTEKPYDNGNSGTAKTLDLANGVFQKVTMTGNATFTMPTPVDGKSFTLRVYTGAGGFTGTFTGVKWTNGAAPTLTTTAARMDLITFLSDGTNWYGLFNQTYTP